MILNQNNLDRWVSVETQEQEINRIKKAKKGDILFEGTVKQCFDIVETLIAMSNIKCNKAVAGMVVTYYKV